MKREKIRSYLNTNNTPLFFKTASIKKKAGHSTAKVIETKMHKEVLVLPFYKATSRTI